MLSPSLRKRRRLEMPLTRQGVAEVPLLGRYNHIRAEPAIPEHAHGEIVEICFLVKGRQTFQVHGRNYHLRGGDIFITFPHEQHSSAGNPQEKGVLYWLMLRKTARSLFGLPAAQSELLWKSLCGLPSRHFHGSWEMKEHLDILTALYHAPGTPLRPTQVSARVISFLLEVLRCAAARVPSKSAGNMQAVTTYIQNHLEEPLSVPELAAQAGLSVSRFKARFKESMGVPPGEYLLRAKIEEARLRLGTGRKSVTEVAFELGFSSSQYFATVFKRFTGNTPRMALKVSAKPFRRAQ